MKPSAKSIAVPISIPVGFALAFVAVMAAGNANIHAGTGVLIFLCGVAVLLVTLWEIVAVPWSVMNLARHPQLRNGMNVAATGLGTIYLLGVFFPYVYVTHAGIAGAH